MKNTFTLLILLCASTLFAQWKSLGADNFPNQQNNAILGVHAPSPDVAWGFVWNLATFAPSQTFVKTTDGGATITTGTINVEDSSLTPLGIFALDEMTAWVAMVSEPSQDYGNVYKTVDGGNTWTQQFAEDSEQAMGVIYFWNENEGIVMGGDGTSNDTDQLQAFHTSDGGNTWTETTPEQLQTGESVWAGSGNGVLEVVDNTVWIGSRSGRVFKSTDRGITWTVSEVFAAGRTINTLAFRDTLNGIAMSAINSSGFSASNKAWSTNDGGSSWDEIDAPDSPAAYCLQYVSETSGNFVLVGGWAGTGTAITTDDGAHWQTIDAPALLGTHFNSPNHAYAGGFIQNDNKGGLYKLVTSFSNKNANVITLAGTTLEGMDNGSNQTASFYNPKNMVMDNDGNIYVADDYNHQIRKISVDGEVSTIAGVAGQSGYLDGLADQALFSRPNGVAIDDNGDLLVAELSNRVIRRITTDGIVETWAGTTAYGSTDGPVGSATFQIPGDIVKDEVGNFYIADDNKIRKIDTSNMVSTLAGSDLYGFEDGLGADAQFAFIWGLGIDHQGNIYAADASNNAIRKITPEGLVTTLGGNGIAGLLDGPAEDALFNFPEDVAVDMQGNIYVADGQNFRVRKITPDSMVTTIAGSGLPSNFFLDGGLPALNGDNEFAQFGRLRGILVKPNGNLLVTSWSNDAVREIQPGIPASALQVLEVKSNKKWRNTPIEHQDQFTFEGSVQNTTMDVANEVQMHLRVSKGNQVILQDASEKINVEALGQFTFGVENILDVTEPGVYDLQFNFESLDEGLFETRYEQIIVTDSLLSNSDQLFYFFYSFTSSNENWYGKVGQQYTLTVADTLTGIHTVMGAAEGTKIYFEVFAIESGQVDTTPIYRSSPVLIDSSAFYPNYFHPIPELVLPPGSYLFSNGVESNDGFFTQAFDTDFQTSNAWYYVPELGNNWSNYHNFYGRPRICAPIISPVFGRSNIITSTNEVIPNLSVTVSPNPFSDKININFKDGEESTQQFQIISMEGKIIDIFEIQSNTQKTIYFDQLPAGSYMIVAPGTNWSQILTKQ